MRMDHDKKMELSRWKPISQSHRKVSTFCEMPYAMEVITRFTLYALKSRDGNGGYKEHEIDQSSN